MITVTNHGAKRIRQRCGISKKSVDRLANIAFEKGLTYNDITGSLKRYVASLYNFNGSADNIRLYGDKIYIFCNGDVLVTVLNTPRKYRDTVNKLMNSKNGVVAN